ncbi:MAG TPA: chalcone isomerase family protein [Bacteroidota bacterium]|nr:chalcone isomerase family protein [Bacteroidota bacterium]
MKQRLLVGALVCAALTVACARAQETVTESSTGKTFPATVKYSSGGTDYTMSLTGTTVRKKFVFKVYAMAHYMQDPPKASKEDALKAILADGKAKQITMEFVRDVDPEKIKEAYTDGFKENATAEEWKSLQGTVEKFVGYFSREVKENDQLVLRWLPGGIIVATVIGEEKPPITDPLFARVLWTIWFGKNSIVDPDELVARIATN